MSVAAEGWTEPNYHFRLRKCKRIRQVRIFTTQRVVSFLVWYSQIGFEKLNATRMSVAGEGWTEPNLHFRLRKCKRIRQVRKIDNKIDFRKQV